MYKIIKEVHGGTETVTLVPDYEPEKKEKLEKPKKKTSIIND